MPGHGAHRFYFVGKEPIAVWAISALLFINTFVGLSLDFGAKYFLPRASASLPACDALTENGIQYHAPVVICWCAARFIEIQFILLALLAAIFVIFRKRVRYVGPRS
jgi:hypothetical protein